MSDNEFQNYSNNEVYDNSISTINNENSRNIFSNSIKKEASIEIQSLETKSTRTASTLISKNSAAILIVAATTATATIITTATSNIQVNVADFTYRANANSISYHISIDEQESLYDMKVKLTNDFTNREEILEYGNNDGRFDNLAENMNYTLGVYVKNEKDKEYNLLSSKDVKTTINPVNLDTYLVNIEDCDSFFQQYGSSVNVKLSGFNFDEHHLTVYINNDDDNETVYTSRLITEEVTGNSSRNLNYEFYRTGEKDSYIFSTSIDELQTKTNYSINVVLEGSMVPNGIYKFYVGRTPVEGVLQNIEMLSPTSGTVRIFVFGLNENEEFKFTISDLNEQLIYTRNIITSDYVTNMNDFSISTNNQIEGESAVSMIFKIDGILEDNDYVICFYDSNGDEIGRSIISIPIVNAVTVNNFDVGQEDTAIFLSGKIDNFTEVISSIDFILFNQTTNNNVQTLTVPFANIESQSYDDFEINLISDNSFNFDWTITDISLENDYTFKVVNHISNVSYFEEEIDLNHAPSLGHFDVSVNDTTREILFDYEFDASDYWTDFKLIFTYDDNGNSITVYTYPFEETSGQITISVSSVLELSNYTGAEVNVSFVHTTSYTGDFADENSMLYHNLGFITIP